MTAYIGYGSTLATATGTFPQCTKLSFPALELQQIESTHLTSADRTKEYVAGLKDGGVITFSQQYTSENLERAMSEKGLTQTFTLTMPDLGVGTWSGFITKCPVNLEVEGVAIIEMEVRVAGAVTFAGA